MAEKNLRASNGSHSFLFWLSKTASGAITTALSELNSSLIWLIVVAFMIARGFIKTGLGRRIALQMIRLLGKRTLGLAYGLAFADLILSPAMPSNTPAGGKTGGERRRYVELGKLVYRRAPALPGLFSYRPAAGLLADPSGN